MVFLHRLISFLPHKLIAVLAVIGLMVGLVTTRVVLSVATITLACNALLHPDVLTHFRMWWRNIPARLFLFLFLAYCVSGLYSQDTGAWWVNTQNKLPLLAIPFGWTVVEKDLAGWVRSFLYALVVVMSLAAMVVMGNYLAHFDALNESIKLGHAVPTPMSDHIRFSLEIAFAALLCIFLISDSGKKTFIHVLMGVFGLILIITLHFLAVRSGLIALYLGIFLFIVYQIRSRKHWRAGLLILAVSITSVILTLRFVPSLHNKLSYFQYEWNLIEKGEMKEGHSDAQRVQSILYGLEVAREHLPTGTGTGDIRPAMSEIYASNPATSNIKYELPHNQFIYSLAATGILGLCALIAAFFFPVVVRNYRQSWIMWSFLFILGLSFMTEHVLEIQIGITFVMLVSTLLPSAISVSNNRTDA